MKRAVASLVRRGEKLLVVWHKTAEGWTLPGGKLDAGETLFQGNARELHEETGLVATKQKLVYQALNTSGVQVSVHEVLASGEPREAERGSPVSWLNEAELMRVSPYSVFYTRMFEKLWR